MKAVILAGGEGKRLRPLTDSTPKPLVKIGGRAIIDRQIEMFEKLGVSEFIVLCGYKNDELQKHFSNSIGTAVYIVVEEKPLGTGGALKAARKRIGNDDFVMINGDIMTDLDLAPILAKDGFLAKIALVPMTSPYGVVKTNGDKVDGFVEKPVLNDIWINAGIYRLGAEVFDMLPDAGSIEKELFPKLAAEGRLGFVKFDINGKFWRSVDTIKDFDEANARFA